MNPNVYRWCAVPECKNTSIKTPTKLFINVPMKKIVRNMWLNLARRDPAAISLNSVIYFCEDHFDLPNDMENYIQYRVMGSISKVRMRPECMPTRFECQPDRRKPTSSTFEQPYVLKKQKRALAEENKPTKNLESAGTSSQSSESLLNLDINTHMEPVITIKKPAQSIETNSSQTSEDNNISSHTTGFSRTNKRRRKQTAEVKLPEAEEIIASVYKFLQAEFEYVKDYIGDICLLSALSKVLKRTAYACGVRECTVKQVVHKTWPQRDLNVVGVGSERAGGEFTCGDSEIEAQDDSSNIEEELETTDSVDEPENNVEQANDDNSITKEKSRCGISDIEQDDIELSGDESEEREQFNCEVAVEVKTESTDVLYSQTSSGVTLVTSLTTVKTEPDDAPPHRNNSNKNPEKLFIQVPDDIKMRNVWLKLAKRDPKALSTRSRLYLCEDHFNLEIDMKNYMEYKIMGSVKHVKMKANITPSRFSWHSESNGKLSPSTNQSTVKTESLDFVLEAENIKLIDDFMEPITTSPKSDIPIFETKTIDKVTEVQTLTAYKSIQIEDIIARVYNYLQSEYEELKSSVGTSCDLSLLANILKRTAAATGISEHTVSAILEEKKRAADDELVAGAAKRAKLTLDSPITNDESSCEASDKEQDDGNEQTDEDSQEQDECELKMEIKIEDENDTFDPLQLQVSKMDSAVGHVVSSASTFCSDGNTIASRIPVQVKIEPVMIVDPQPKPQVVPTMTPVLQLRGSAFEVTRVTTLNLYTPVDVTPNSSAACTSDMVCDGLSEPDVP